jgi:1-aminocyclopropane-1-carboxylate deaminase
MTLDYLDRTTYREKASPAVEEGLRQRFGDFFLIPEGGSNPAAVRGAAEIATEFPPDYDIVCCPCGTGGTLAGLAAGLPPGRPGRVGAPGGCGTPVEESVRSKIDCHTWGPASNA